jgi:hypothetical protein
MLFDWLKFSLVESTLNYMLLYSEMVYMVPWNKKTYVMKAEENVVENYLVTMDIRPKFYFFHTKDGLNRHL